ncbi:MAG TPA: FxLYD domain-containing protein [Chthonomonadaceae bacterium]|nr:FxLYD domain-containing protein [Chthonomonadaceae bacterium]
MIAVVCVVFFVYRSTTQAIDTIKTRAKQAPIDLKVVSYRLASDHGHRFVVGALKNSSATNTYSTVHVQFDLLDKAGSRISTVDGGYSGALKPGASWRFKIPVKSSAARSARLRQTVGVPDMIDLGKNLSPEQKAQLKQLEDKIKTEVDKTLNDSKERK